MKTVRVMESGRRLVTVALAAVGAMLTGIDALAEPASYPVDEQSSHFAVITHADGLGHDHLITAADYQVELSADEADLAASRFTFSVAVRDLAVNAADEVEALLPRLRALGIVNADFPSLSEDDRATMIERIRSAEQLDAAGHPTVTARLLGVTDTPAEWNDHVFPQQVDIALTVRGRTVQRRVPATVMLSDARLQATAVGSFRFTEFGIEPFRAALGVLSNADVFHVYVELRAGRE